MSLPASYRQVGPLVAAAGQTDFPVDFPALQDAAIFAERVRDGVRDTLDLDDFSLVDKADDGFTLRLATGAQAGDVLFVYSSLEGLDRSRTYGADGALRSPAVEADLNEAVARTQEAAREIRMSLRLPRGDAPVILPPEAGRGGKVFVWSADGRAMDASLALDDLLAAFHRLAPVDAVATADVALSGAQVIDGVAVGAGERVLTAGQADATERTVWIAGPEAWTLSPDADSQGDLLGGQVIVLAGDVHAGQVWACRTAAPITVGTTPLEWVQLPTGLTYSAGAGLLQVGNEFSLDLAQTDPWTAKQTFAKGVEITAGQDGAGAYGLVLSNAAAASAVGVYGDPGRHGVGAGARGGYLTWTDDGGGHVTARLAIANAGAPADALIANPDRTLQLPGYPTAGRLAVSAAGLVSSVPQADLTVHDIGGGGLVDLAAWSADVVYLSNGSGSAINAFGGTAPAGTIKTIVNGGANGLMIWFAPSFDSDIIGYKNEGGAVANPGLPLRPGDSAAFVHEGAGVWRLLNHQPSGFWQYSPYYGSGSASSDPPENVITLGPIVGDAGASQPSYSIAFKWGAGAGKIQVHGMHFLAPGDTPSIEFRQAGATAGGAGKNTTELGFFGAHISGRPIVLKGDGSYDVVVEDGTLSTPSTSSNSQGFSQRIIFPTTDAPSRGGTPGALVFMTTAPGGYITPMQRAWVSDKGFLVAAGKATHEAAHLGLTWTASGGGYRVLGAQSGDANYYETQGWGNVSIVMTDVGDAQCDNAAGLAMRFYGNHGRGVDFSTNLTDWIMSRVNGGTRTDLLYVRPSDGTVKWANHLHSMEFSSAGGTAWPLTLKNPNAAANSGVGIYFQPSLDTTNGAGHLSAINNGANGISLSWYGSNNAAPTARWTIFNSGVMRVWGIGAGTVSTNASGDFSASSDETLKVLKGAFADSLPADLEPAPGETRAMAALRAVGRAQLYGWAQELADIAEARAALPELEARCAALPGEISALETAAAQAREAMLAEADDVGGQIDAHLAEMGPLTERVLTRHELRAAVASLDERLGQAAAAQKALRRGAPGRAQADGAIRALTAQRTAAAAALAELEADAEQRLAPLEVTYRGLAERLLDVRNRIARHDEDIAAGVRELRETCEGLERQRDHARFLTALDDGLTTYVGVTAQQLQRGAPCAVKAGPDGKLRKDDRGELAIYNEVLHDVLDELARLRAEVAALKPAV